MWIGFYPGDKEDPLKDLVEEYKIIKQKLSDGNVEYILENTKQRSSMTLGQ